MQEAARVGLFAVLFVALLAWVLRENRDRENRYVQREEKYVEREQKYLEIIKALGDDIKERLVALERAFHQKGDGSDG
jgi:uncharacterized protein YxeA